VFNVVREGRRPTAPAAKKELRKRNETSAVVVAPDRKKRKEGPCKGGEISAVS